MENIAFKTLLLEWQGQLLKTKGIVRESEEPIYRSLGSKPMKIITGFRRSGKSFLVRQLAARAIANGLYAPQNVLYLNFEDFRLTEVAFAQQLHDLYKLFCDEIATAGRKLIIFDEIQRVADWDRLVRTIYEMDGDTVELMLTGSNSELLSSELGSNLAGRFIEFFILPFSFKEYLAYQNIAIKNENEFLRSMRELQKKFSEYLQFGGLPELLTITDESAKKSYLQGIISKVMLSDIVERFKLKNPAVAERILYFLACNAGNIVSFKRIAAFLSQMTQDTSAEAVIHYVSCIQKSFALFDVPRFDWKQARLFETTRKYYGIDTGIINVWENTVNTYSKQLENAVFLQLKRRGGAIYFGALPNGREIDFIVKEKENTFAAYQVTSTINDENIKREWGVFGDEPAKMFFRKYLLTMDAAAKVPARNGGDTITCNLIRWLLE